MLDNVCLKLTTENENLLVPWFIMSCFAYYENDRPLLSDSAFDDLTKRLSEAWDKIKHMHKGLVDPTDFKTGHYLQYPTRIKFAVEYLEKHEKEVDKGVELDYLIPVIKKEAAPKLKFPEGDLRNCFDF